MFIAAIDKYADAEFNVSQDDIHVWYFEHIIDASRVKHIDQCHFIYIQCLTRECYSQ